MPPDPGLATCGQKCRWVSCALLVGDLLVGLELAAGAAFFWEPLTNMMPPVACTWMTLEEQQPSR